MQQRLFSIYPNGTDAQTGSRLIEIYSIKKDSSRYPFIIDTFIWLKAYD